MTELFDFRASVNTVLRDRNEARSQAAGWAQRAEALDAAVKALEAAYSWEIHDDVGVRQVTPGSFTLRTIETNGAAPPKPPSSEPSVKVSDDPRLIGTFVPRGQEAVLRVLMDNPETAYDAKTMLAELDARRWKPEGTAPEQSTRVALRRLHEAGSAIRVDKEGRGFMYKLATHLVPMAAAVAVQHTEPVGAPDSGDSS